MLTACVPLAVSWLAIAGVPSYAVWCVARFMSGMAYGSAYTVLPTYLSEVASDEIRGLVAFIFVLMMKFGLVTIYAVGPVLSVGALSGVALAPLVVFALAYRWIPETPYYLVACGREADARRTVRRLRGIRVDDGSAQAANLEREEIEKIGATLTGALGMRQAFGELLGNAPLRRSLGLMCAYITLLVFSGSQTLLSYAQLIIDAGVTTTTTTPDSGGGGGILPNGAQTTILLGVVQIPAVLVASFFVDSFGRRPLFLGSVIGTLACNCAIGGVFWARRWEDEMMVSTSATVALRWLMMAAIVLYFVFYVIGMCAVFAVLVAEIFPTAVRGIASAVVLSVGAFVAAGVSKMFQVVGDAYGLDWSFGIFAASEVIALVYFWRAMPETKGRSLAQIQEMIAGGGAVGEGSCRRSHNTEL